MARSGAEAIGILTGVVVGVICSLFILRSINKNHKLRTEYDEMQKRVRGEAYMYGFFALVFYEALLGLAEIITKLPVDPLVLHFMGILIGVTVQAGYSIWHDAYVGLNTQTNRFLITMVVIGGINLFVAIMAWMDGRMVKDGILQTPFINFMVFVVFLILGIIGLVKKTTAREED